MGVRQVECRMTLSWDFYDIHLIIRWEFWAWRRKIMEVQYHLHDIIPRTHTLNIIMMTDVDFDPLLEVMVASVPVKAAFLTSILNDLKGARLL